MASVESEFWADGSNLYVICSGRFLIAAVGQRGNRGAQLDPADRYRRTDGPANDIDSRRLHLCRNYRSPVAASSYGTQSSHREISPDCLCFRIVDVRGPPHRNRSLGSALPRARPLRFHGNRVLLLKRDLYTLGYGDIVPEVHWRLLATLEAANGFILFGWTTALVFAVLRELGQHFLAAK